MINILIIDTARPQMSLALISESGDSIHVNSTKDYQHARDITIEIEKLLVQGNIKMANIHAVALNEGPGSFTGLRVGSSVAKGLCYGLDIPLIAIRGLEGYGQYYYEQRKADYQTIFVLLDARRDNYFYTEIKDGKIQTQTKLESYQKIEQEITQATKPFVIMAHERNSVDAQMLSLEVWKRWTEKNFVDIQSFQPNYYINNYQKP